MGLLLDTHSFIWWVDDAPALSPIARQRITDETQVCFVSIASAWEMAIKASLGKLRLTMPVRRYVQEQVLANGFRLLHLSLDHVTRVEALPMHHRDPFDRLLIAQAQIERLHLVSVDARFDDYDVTRIW